MLTGIILSVIVGVVVLMLTIAAVKLVFRLLGLALQWILYIITWPFRVIIDSFVLHFK